METFGTWLNDELVKRDWSMSELGRRTGYSYVTISHLISGQRNPSLKLCTKIAKAFRLPAETVYKKAGLFPPDTTKADEQSREFVYLFNLLPENEQETVLILIRALVAAREKKGL